MNSELLLNYFNRQAYLHRKPVSVVIELLTKCNLRCEHCYLPQHKNGGFKKEEILSLLTELREMGVINVLLTGGEIFLREDIFEIIEHARNLCLRVTLLSNATLLNEEKVHELSNLYITEFSTTIFSLDEKIHDSITQNQGSLKKALIGIDLLKKYNISVKIKMPIMSKNANSFDSVKEYCDKNNFEFMPSLAIMSKNDGNTAPHSLRVDRNTMLKLADKIYDKNQLNNNFIHRMKEPCAGILSSFSIDCNGDVYPCNSLPVIVGNVFREKVSNIWNFSSKLYEIQNIRREELIECEKCKYKEICDRCPGVALLEGKGLYSCDPIAKSISELKFINFYKAK